MDREFHISKKVREKYDFDRNLYGLSGNVVFADFHSVRIFAHKMNIKRDLEKNPNTSIKTGHLHAMGLLDEIFHYMFRKYAEEKDDNFVEKTVTRMEKEVGKESLDKILQTFTEEFPPSDVYNGSVSIKEYLSGETEGISNRAVALEELMLLWLANENPAFEPYKELFDDKNLKENTDYLLLIDKIDKYYDDTTQFGPKNQSFVELLLAPIKSHPNSLLDQLNYIRKYWQYLIQDLLFRILTSVDMIKEETKAVFHGPGPSRIYEFRSLDEDAERFSPDRDWMPKTILIAKSIYVWLDQMSKKYKKNISRLDQIPEEEINMLASQGFTGLWLIGLWERSKASKEIKRRCGNPEAEASAYSLMDYEIAERLGGWKALSELRSKCTLHGIRLASDMVPNHTGIDSRWVIEHPDWFIQLPYSPFPSYSFEGENLSGDNRIGIYIEDHYYDKTDAAVVFKRVDFDSGDQRFIYHGNDGTGMPWNDTAQLNFLNPATKEGVIQTILHVARNFPIIRFDAAMTLAKKHYQRLWFPEPGSGGDIPSRAEHGMTRQELDSILPKEFWREVVERVAEEVPDTLLLAEAFWMMEGYFVRSLGMHRVYNSAFMNMLKDEENSKYQQTIRNTLNFDPEILKRFVNFMNNPDEETAVEQFGKGDKYFGICTLMVTMPGLPMFGHGQIEGFREKYGMEYNKAYWEEAPDKELIRRHEREIFPLMKRRYLYADAQNFKLYELISDDNIVNQNVFAYSNSYGLEHTLVLYNNSYSTAWGRIKSSVEFLEKNSDGSKNLRQISLGKALGLHHSDIHYCIFREQRSNLWFIRTSKEIFDDGLFVRLQGYQSQVFLDIYEVVDNDQNHYSRLYSSLAGAGVENIDDALLELYLAPLYERFHSLFDEKILSFVQNSDDTQLDEKEFKLLTEKYKGFYEIAQEYSEHQLKKRKEFIPLFEKVAGVIDKELLEGEADKSNELKLSSYGWIILRNLESENMNQNFESNIMLHNRNYVTRWRLIKQFDKILDRAGIENPEWIKKQLIFLIYFENLEMTDPVSVFKNSLIQESIGLNEYEGVVWFNKESFENTCNWIFWAGMLGALSAGSAEGKKLDKQLKQVSDTIVQFKSYAEKSGYRYDSFLSLLKKEKNGGN